MTGPVARGRPCVVIAGAPNRRWKDLVPLPCSRATANGFCFRGLGSCTRSQWSVAADRVSKLRARFRGKSVRRSLPSVSAPVRSPRVRGGASPSRTAVGVPRLDEIPRPVWHDLHRVGCASCMMGVNLATELVSGRATDSTIHSSGIVGWAESPQNSVRPFDPRLTRLKLPSRNTPRT